MALQESLEVVRASIEFQNGAVSSWIEVIHPNLNRPCLSRSAKACANAKSVIRALLAGPATLLRYSFGTYPRDCPLPEFNLANPWMAEQEAVWRAISLAGKISNGSPSLVRSLWREVNNLIQGDKIWPAIEAVAHMLLITGELTGCEMREITRHALGSN